MNEPTIEGIAVDPTAKKVYLLALDIREKTLAQDREDSSGVRRVARGLHAVRVLDAGSQRRKPRPRRRGRAEHRILTGPAPLRTQSETPGNGAACSRAASRLTPRPAKSSSSGTSTRTNGRLDEPTSADHYALQRIESGRERRGREYVDTTDVLKKELEPRSRRPRRSSSKPAAKSTSSWLRRGRGTAGRRGARNACRWARRGIAQGTERTRLGRRLSTSPDGTVWGATGSINNETAPRSGASRA